VDVRILSGARRMLSITMTSIRRSRVLLASEVMT